MLKKLNIKRFKNIDNLTLEFDKVNILIGSNNSGKSSVLQAIQFAVSVIQSAKLDGSANWVHNVLSTTLAPSQLVYTPLRDVEALAPGRVLTQNAANAMSFEFIDDMSNKLTIQIRRGKNKNIAVALTGMEYGRQLENVTEPYTIFVPGLAGIAAVEEYKSPGIVGKAAARGDANNVFRNVLWLLKNQPEKWTKFLTNFGAIFPEIELDIAFDPERDDYLDASLKWSGRRLPIDAAGTGCLQAIQILSYVNLYNPKLLILDEPDSHLHPTNQRVLARMLGEIVEERDIQIVLATHSRHLTDELLNKAQLHWIRSGERVDDEHLDFANILMELGALDKGDLLQSGKIKCFVLTEDSDEKPLCALLQSSGFKLDEVDVWSYKGCTKLEAANILIKFIKRYAPAATIVIHKDRDYYNSTEINEEKTKLEVLGVLCFMTSGNDCESYFINAGHIHQLYNQIDIESAIRLVNETTSENREKSIRKFTNTRFNIKKLRYREANPDPAATYQECERLYDSNPDYYKHGKMVLGPLKSKLQTIIKDNPNLFRATSALTDADLQRIAQQIWPSTQ